MAVLSHVQTCVRLIKEAKSIGALTGAGISTNAGVPDFRGPQGLYVTKRYDADKIFDIDHFEEDPAAFYEFARDFLSLEAKLQPTFAHTFLAQLESSGKLKGLVTQNIDALHHKAGSQNVLEMHGSFWKSHCRRCRKEFAYTEIKTMLNGNIAKFAACSCGGVIKPDIVFFGENVKYLDEAYALASRSDLFFVIGTSCVVYPAAMLPSLVPGKIVIVNKGKVHLNLPNVVLEIQDDIDGFFKEVAESL